MFLLIESGATFVAFDTETTGLSPEECRIIEIGAVKFNSTGILDSFNTLINPLQNISWQITQITHIDNKMVQNSPEISSVIPSFKEFVKDSIIIGHNIQFDLRFLKAECERNGFSSIKNDTIDTLQLCRWTFPEEGHYKQTLMAEKFGINITEAHRAYDDAFVCGSLFLHCIKETADRQK